MEILTPGFGLIFWMFVSFLIVLYILKKFAWKPILEAIKQREEFVENSLKQAEQARKELESVKDEAKKILAQARKEREEMIKEAQNLKNRMLAQAEEEAKKLKARMIQEANQEIENAKQAALKEVKDTIAELSIEIAEKILRSELQQDKKQKEYIQKLLSETNLN